MNAFIVLLLVIVAASLACIAVALWGIWQTIKQVYTLFEKLVKLVVKTFGKFNL